MAGTLARFLRRNTIALLALFLALGGTSFAAATLLNGSQIKPHTIAKNRLTNKAIKQLKGNRGARGLQGTPGTQGPKGTTGTQGPAGPGASWASVKFDGTIAVQTGGITALRASAGRYFVTFGEDVSHRLLLTSSTIIADIATRGTVLIASCSNPLVSGANYCQNAGVTDLPNSVAVWTTALDNTTFEDHDFYVAEMGPTGTGTPAGPSGVPARTLRALLRH